VRPGCHLVNVGRGSVVDEAAVLAALDAGRLSHASLDVFAQEPLPDDHPFWSHPSVSMTPHLAGPLIPEDVVPHFVANFHAFRQGAPMKNVVAPERQY
jgi:glyoxylate/hydroxypyruvate reductase A